MIIFLLLKSNPESTCKDHWMSGLPIALSGLLIPFTSHTLALVSCGIKAGIVRRDRWKVVNHLSWSNYRCFSLIGRVNNHKRADEAIHFTFNGAVLHSSLTAPALLSGVKPFSARCARLCTAATRKLADQIAVVEPVKYRSKGGVLG
jgi:hypothetical protein